MVTNHIPAVFGVNKFLWAKIQEAGLMNSADYSGLTPIIPIQEEAELLNVINAQDGIKTLPYIVYTWYSNGDAKNWWEQEDQVIYIIKSLDQTKLRQLVLLIRKYLKRWDDSARAVNDYVQNPANGLSAEYLAYIYKYIDVQALTGGVPSTAENEPIKATVTVQICYTNDDNDNPL